MTKGLSTQQMTHHYVSGMAALASAMGGSGATRIVRLVFALGTHLPLQFHDSGLSAGTLLDAQNAPLAEALAKERVPVLDPFGLWSPPNAYPAHTDDGVHCHLLGSLGLGWDAAKVVTLQLNKLAVGWAATSTNTSQRCARCQTTSDCSADEACSHSEHRTFLHCVPRPGTQHQRHRCSGCSTIELCWNSAHLRKARCVPGDVRRAASMVIEHWLANGGERHWEHVRTFEAFSKCGQSWSSLPASSSSYNACDADLPVCFGYVPMMQWGICLPGEVHQMLDLLGEQWHLATLGTRPASAEEVPWIHIERRSCSNHSGCSAVTDELC